MWAQAFLTGKPVRLSCLLPDSNHPNLCQLQIPNSNSKENMLISCVTLDKSLGST